MKNILISGASKGIGLAISKKLLEEKNRVFAFARNENADVLALKKDFPNSYEFAEFDLSDAKNLPALVLKALEFLGEIDALINNAAIAKDGIFALAKDEDIDAVLNLNISATLKLTRQVVREMLLNKNGASIVNMGSIVGHSGYRGLAIYSASKAALDGLTRALARELGAKKIRVNSLCPGFIETEMSAALDEHDKQKIISRTPLGRLGTPEDIANLCAFLVSDKSAFISGQSIIIDGGISA